MVRRIFILILAGALLGYLAAPAPANDRATGRGSVYERKVYDDPYAFVDDQCGFKFKVKGRSWGRYVIYNAKGSQGQAFLVDDRYHFQDVLTNPRNGKKMYISGEGRFWERSATHVEGDIWEFFSVDEGRPFVVKNARRQTVLVDHGKVVFRQVFDTLGDSKPGGEELEHELVRVRRGDFPSLEPGFDFCRMVRRLIG